MADSESADDVATKADAQLEGIEAPQLALILDIAKTALADAQARASALDSKSLAAIGFAVGILVLVWPRLGGPPALSFEYLIAAVTSLAAMSAATLSALGFTLARIDGIDSARYLPPPKGTGSGSFPTDQIGLLRRHITTAHVMSQSLEQVNDTRASYLRGAQILLIIASVSGLLAMLNASVT